MANGGLWLAVCRQRSAHFWDINNKIHGEAVSMFVFIHLLTSSFNKLRIVLKSVFQ